ncbi:MAG: hypothetical protein ACTHN0_13890 [Aquihabitans sp.]
MSYRPNRLRRPASPKKIQALRLAGWRYSSKRSAWVHRAFNGRVGPVFVDPTDTHPRIDETIVIDHQGPRRGFEAPGIDPIIELQAGIVPYAPLDGELVIEAVAAPAVAIVPEDPTEADELAAVAEATAIATAVVQPTHLADRALDRHRPEMARLPLPPRPLDLAPAPSPAPSEQIHVEVQLSEFEAPRIVRVDGRPPRLGPPPEVPADDVVVPFKPVRAFG